MDELRWFLLIVGLCIIAAIFAYGVWEEHQAKRESGGSGLFGKTPDIDAAFDNLDEISRQAAAKKPQRPEPPAHAPGPAPQPEPEEESLAEEDFEPEFELSDLGVDPEPDEPDLKIDPVSEQQSTVQGTEEKVVVLYVSGGEQYMYGGRDLVAAVEAAGLHYGAHDIFHASADNGRVAMFSAANMLEPGTFDLERLDEISSPGLALFMQLPGPYDGLEAFEQMLVAGRQIADQLGAQLLDGRRSSLTQQAVEHIREELLEYRRRAHLAARKQSR